MSKTNLQIREEVKNSDNPNTRMLLMVYRELRSLQCLTLAMSHRRSDVAIAEAVSRWSTYFSRPDDEQYSWLDQEEA